MAGERRDGRRLAITWILIDLVVVAVVLLTLVAVFLGMAEAYDPFD